MRSRLCLVAVLALVDGHLIAAVGCATRQEAHQPTGFPEVVRAAWDTYARHVKAVQAGTEVPSEEIPERYWSDGIKALRPVKVYTHRVNIVVVQRVTKELEEGKYIYIPISSYIPHSGDDRFTFTACGGDVYDFKRTR